MHAFRDFQNLCKGLLDQCFNTDREKTEQLIKRRCMQFYPHTCLSLAELTDHREFISHQAVQTFMNKVWYGSIKDSNISWIHYLIAYIFPPYICTFEFRKHTSHEQKGAEPKPSLPTSNGNKDIKTEETALVDK